jgi:hypothetical protein
MFALGGTDEAVSPVRVRCKSRAGSEWLPSLAVDGVREPLSCAQHLRGDVLALRVETKPHASAL